LLQVKFFVMKTSFRKFAFLVLFFHPFFHLSAQLALNAEIRPRLEIRDGYKSLPGEEFSPAAFVSQRNRLGLQFQGQNIETNISFQNILIWGSEPLKSNQSSIGLYQAWLKFRIGDSLYIKSGRQELMYDNQRLFSNNNWINPGQRHDLILLQYYHPSFRLDMGFAFNQETERLSGTEYNLGGNYKSMNFVYFSAGLAANGKISLISITDGFQDTFTGDKTNFRFTNGGTYSYRYDNFDFLIAGYFQNGFSPDHLKINAWYTHFHIAYKLNNELQIETGIEVFSGKDFSIPGDDKIRAFDAAYGAGHRYNGSMDYFTSTEHTRGAGLVNPYLSLIWRMNKLARFKTDVHLFNLQNNYIFNETIIDKYLGTELDFAFSRDFQDGIMLSTGYSIMFAGKSMEIIKGGYSGRPANWFFISLCFKPDFLI
jgi:hypothetical protein